LGTDTMVLNLQSILCDVLHHCSFTLLEASEKISFVVWR
jgi:hypothetical protein